MGFEEWFSLEGKIALVTGASRGLGQSAAIGLARAGADLVCLSRDQEGLEETSRLIRKTDRRALSLVTDVGSSEQVEQSVSKALETFGRIDILVNNAAVMLGKASEKTTEEEWDNVIRTNLKGTFLCSRVVGTHMIEKGGGKIINVGSIFGVTGTTHCLAYASSKAAVHQLTRSLAVEWATYGITVNAIVPGYFDTEMPSKILGDPQFRKTILDRMPLGRIGHPEEIRPLVVFLASRASDFMTGQMICMDGGYSVALYF
jgi:NAD(P)-dependent dehydrogenase (short-subunit alcohol dehydrogenase family)